ncbi:MAG: 30S ribosome-binding factor RbfA [bacterium]
MSSRRLIRVAEVIRAEIGRLIARERSLENALLTITSVNVSPDLKEAFVYCSSLNAKLSGHETLVLLERARVSWQSILGKKMKTKHTPRLSFRMDDAQKRGDRVLQILDEIVQEEEKGEGAS